MSEEQPVELQTRPPPTTQVNNDVGQSQRDGNVLQKSRTIHHHIRLKFTGPNGVFTKFLISIDFLLLACSVLVQTGLIAQIYKTPSDDFFTIYLFYLLPIGICMLLFYYSVINARRYYQRKCSVNSEERSNCRSFSVLSFNYVFPAKMGELPFIYISWFFYTCYLVCLIISVQPIIIDPNLQAQISSNQSITLFEAALALTSVIFILFMEAHRNSEDDLHFEQTSSWTDSLMQHSAMEIFDSVILLDLIMPDHHGHSINKQYREITLVLAIINFFMPVLGLFHLSQLASSINLSCSSLNLIGMSQNIFLHAFRLVGVNFAYLAIRVFTSPKNQISSIFIIKNLLGILMGGRSLFKEIFEYIQKRKQLQHRRNQKCAISGDNAAQQALRTDGIQVDPIDLMTKDENFDEISLNSVKTNRNHRPQV